MTELSRYEMRWIPIDDIKERDDLPTHGGRRHEAAYALGDKKKDKENSSLANLIKSIEELGLIQIIAVDDDHHILAGRRRLEAMKRLGYKEVPCRVVGAVDRTQAFTIMLHENIRRLNLSDTESALMIDAFDEVKRELTKTVVLDSPKLGEDKIIIKDKRKEYWTQEDTAKTLGISKGSVHRAKIISQAIREMPKIASQTGTTILRTVRRKKAVKDLVEKGIEKKPDHLTSGNFWYFNDRDPRFGIAKYKHGVVPGQAIENLLWIYTNKGDLVVDPMAGGGTVLDVCKLWKRPCLAYDIDVVRDDIIHNDIWKGLPKKCKGAKLIYLDPPYGLMVQNAYKTMEAYFKFQDHIVNVAAENVAEDGVVAYIIMDYSARDKGGKRYGLGKSLIGEAYRALQDHPALEFEASISVPIPQAGFRYTPFEIVKKEHNLVGLNRIIWVAKKIAV